MGQRWHHSAEKETQECCWAVRVLARAGIVPRTFDRASTTLAFKALSSETRTRLSSLSPCSKVFHRDRTCSSERVKTMLLEALLLYFYPFSHSRSDIVTPKRPDARRNVSI